MDLIIKWLKEIFYAGFDIMVANLFWALLTILLVTAPPAAAGLYYTSNLAAHGQPVEWRTLFEGFHHFRPAQAQAILQDAVDNRAAIGVFEAILPPPWGPLVLALSPLMTILGMILTTPFIVPRSLVRFLWTYLIPIVPLTTSWDGVVSFLRVYSATELRELVASTCCEDYVWDIGTVSTGMPLFALGYLIGYPVAREEGCSCSEDQERRPAA